MNAQLAAAPPATVTQRATTFLRTSKGGLAVLALVIGAGAGLGAVVFRWLIKTFTQLLSGHGDYSAAGHAANPHVPFLGPYFVVLAPVVAGLLYGPLVQRFAREARGHGVPEVMYAVARRGGRIAPQVAGVKALASALCIGGGGSVGREGPIVQIGSALGSTLGQIAKLSESRIKMLVACGAAGGIAATFNAPLAGVFFAMELILRDFAAESFGMVVLSSVTASVIGRSMLGDTPFITLPAFHVQHLAQYGLFALLGLLAGLVGVGFNKVLYRIEDACDAVWRGPEWARPAVGGLLLGLLLLVLPEMYGVGYPVLEHALAGGYALLFLLALLVGKTIATSLTIGIGGSGGVFAPSLFVGAMLGSAFGQGAHQLMPSIAGSAGAYGIVGMGAVFAGAARAPITAVVILFELTGEYSIILPLMAAIVIATGVSRLLSYENIYTAKLMRRGIDLDAPVDPADALTVAQAMTGAAHSLLDSTPLAQAPRALAHDRHGIVPLTGPDGSYRGAVHAHDLMRALADGADPATPVAKFADTDHPTALRDASLASARDLLGTAGTSGLPVLDREGDGHLVGWIDHSAILHALHHSSAGEHPVGLHLVAPVHTTDR
ncbi:chloride channel protein [Streptacidiphilus anmyonensis]|uniref:chloride channel protein n=1 Tax=Streptacidiphilus anmyonensis TaxID=405782 RepID=UPI0005AB91E5|nr:chloride channel protein [Streptacidiphilus anmyonensis]